MIERMSAGKIRAAANSRKIVILLGARQVGKTWLMKTFGEKNYKKVAYISFYNNQAMKDILLEFSNKEYEVLYITGDKYYEEFKKLNAVFKGSMHTIGYIVDALKRQNYTNSYCEIYGDLYFECWREELDTSDKYNPYMKKVTYKERVTPISKALFLKELERRLKL